MRFGGSIFETALIFYGRYVLLFTVKCRCDSMYEITVQAGVNSEGYREQKAFFSACFRSSKDYTEVLNSRTRTPIWISCSVARI